MGRNLAGSQELEDERGVLRQKLTREEALAQHIRRYGILDLDWEDIERALLGRTAREFSQAEYRKMVERQSRYFGLLGH